MSRKYRFYDLNATYFVTWTVVRWLDVFTRDAYRQIILDSLAYCQREKGLHVHAWVIMTNHLHLIVSADEGIHLGHIMRDAKAFTSRHIRKELEHATGVESRQDWLLYLLQREGLHNAANHDFQLWQHDSHPVALTTREMVLQRLEYLHLNPVRAGFVNEAEHWCWSSAADYVGERGLLEIEMLEW